jgi:hypothetical protein
MGAQQAEEGLIITGNQFGVNGAVTLRPGGRRRLRRAVAGVVAALVLVGPLSALGSAAPDPFPCRIPGRITAHPAHWYSINVPDFPVGAQSVSGYSVEPSNPKYLYVTNGASVMRSTDGGCEWDVSYALPESNSSTALSASNARILEIELSSGGVVYLPIQQSTSAGPRPRVLVSRDHGGSWAAADGPALASTLGNLRDFDVAAGFPGSAYALVDVENAELPAGLSVKAGQILFATRNAGTTWEPRAFFRSEVGVSRPGAGVVVTGDEELERVTASPDSATRVWIYGRGGVFVSNGFGANDVGLGPTGVLDVSPDGALVLAYDRDAPGGHMSTDGGASFESFNLPVAISSAAAISAPPFAAVGGLGRVYFQMGNRLVDVSPLDRRAVSDVQFAPTQKYRYPLVFAHTNYSIEVLAIPNVVKFDKAEEVETGSLGPGGPRVPGVLTPRRERLVLRAGRSRTIPYSLALRSSATPVDIYFLIDISGSMQGTINGVRAAMQSIVDRLSETGLDALFGVGAFRSFDDAPAYQRVRDIGPSDEELRRALDSLSARGGGQETQMAALYESVTGEGRYGVPPDLNMNFRPSSLKIAILVTDEPISQAGNHPPISMVVDSLVEADVNQVGLAIQPGPAFGPQNYENPGEPASALQRVARGSKAVAPEGGVDCDGDPQIEIPEGDPLVCIVSPDRSSEAELMADVIVHVVEAVQDIQDLRPAVTPSTSLTVQSEVVDSVSPNLFPERDLKQPQGLSFDVTVRCPDVRERKTFPLTVGVDARRSRLADASLVVVCKPPPPREEEEPPVLPVLSAFVPRAAILPPPPRPPEPVPEPNPNPNPNPQANPQPQAGFALQRQEQPQLAFAYDDGIKQQPVYRQASDDLNMSTPRRRPGAPAGLFVVAAGALSSLFAYVLALERSRHDPGPAYARRRRRRP